MTTYNIGDNVRIKIDSQGYVSKTGQFEIDSTIIGIEKVWNDHSKIYAYIVVNNHPARTSILSTNVIASWRSKGYIDLISNVESYVGKAKDYVFPSEIDEIIVQTLPATKMSDSSHPAGMTCCDPHCREYNNWAEPNQPDGTYKCYSCRNRH